jgi:predicted SAM-dependent methyltransferase
MEFIVPDSWPMPTENEICLCLDCGMIYYDNDSSQEKYDEYYNKYYGYDTSLTGIDAHKRLEDLTDLSMEICPDKNSVIIDFGGGEGIIEKILKENGYNRIFTINPKDKFPEEKADLIIASQVLEHIYDLHGMMEKLILHIKKNGKFLIELPDAINMMNAPLPILDYHEKHVNHFLPTTLDIFFDMYGYLPTYQYRCFEKSHFGYIYRVVYERINSSYVYYLSKEIVEKNVEEKVKKLFKIDFPVQIWGCGDICMHLLTKVKLDVVNYIDNDPAYRDQTIGGIPVTTNVLEDVPIVIIAQNQVTSIVNDIKNKNLKNEVIII